MWLSCVHIIRSCDSHVTTTIRWSLQACAMNGSTNLSFTGSVEKFACVRQPITNDQWYHLFHSRHPILSGWFPRHHPSTWVWGERSTIVITSPHNRDCSSTLLYTSLTLEASWYSTIESAHVYESLHVRRWGCDYVTTFTPPPHHLHSSSSPPSLLLLTTFTPPPHHLHSSSSPPSLLLLTTFTPPPHHLHSSSSPPSLLLLTTFTPPPHHLHSSSSPPSLLLLTSLRAFWWLKIMQYCSSIGACQIVICIVAFRKAIPLKIQSFFIDQLILLCNQSLSSLVGLKGSLLRSLGGASPTRRRWSCDHSKCEAAGSVHEDHGDSWI